MPIDATFEANFDAFHREVTKAEKEVRSLAGSATGVETSFTKMSGQSTNAFSSMATGLSQADKLLASVGVSIGREINALRELGDISAKSATQLGALATAGAVFSAAMAGWQIGSKIAELTSLDEKLGDGIAWLAGWTDKAEVAAYKLDVLAKASQTAGREITDFSEAIKINERAAQEHAESFNTDRVRVSAWQQEIRNVRAAGDLEALEKAMAAGNSTLKELSGQYDISVRALEYYQREVKKTTAAEAERSKAAEANAKALRDTMNWVAEEEIKAVAKANAEKEKLDRAYREYKNFEGQRLMEAEAARMAAEAQAVEAAKAAETAAYDSWFQSVHEGLLIVGQDIEQITQTAKTAISSWSEAMAAVSAGQGTLTGTIPAGDPGTLDARLQRWWELMREGGFPIHGSIAGRGGLVSPSWGTTVTNNFTVNGTGEQVARTVMDEISRTMKTTRKWPTS